MISRFSSYRKEILLTLTILISAFTILGWNLDINELKGDFHNFIPMSQSGAICFASISLSLLIYLRLQSRFFHVIGYYLLGLVWMYAGLVLSRFILHFKFDPEGIFVVTSWMKGFIPKGRMSPVTALIFILLISSFFVHILHLNNTFQKIKKVTIIIIGIGCFLLITGYLYNTPLLYSENIIPVSFPAALLSFFLSLVLINIYKIKLFSDKLKQQSFISWHLSKAFIPVVLVLVIVHGFIHANIIYTSANPAVAAVLLLIVAIVITILIINDLSKSIGNSIELMEL